MKKMDWKNGILLLAAVFIMTLLVECTLQISEDSQYEVVNYEFNYTVNLNANGYRDDDFSLTKPSTRILMIGDSFIFGSGVGDHATIPSIIESQTDFDVYNLGWPGNDLQDYYETALGFQQYNPDVVILSVYVDNDIQRNKTKKNSLVERFKESKLVSLISRVKRSNRCVYDFIESYEVPQQYKNLACKGQINPWLLPRAKTDNDGYYYFLFRVFDEETYTKNVITAIQDLYPSADFILLVNPSKYQVSTRYHKYLTPLGFKFRNETVSHNVQDAIMHWAQNQNINIINPLPLMQNSSTSYYYNIDDHYNVAGNKLIASLIVDQLSSMSNPAES